MNQNYILIGRPFATPRPSGWNGVMKVREDIWVAAVCGRHTLVHAQTRVSQDSGQFYDVWKCKNCGVAEHRFL